MLYKYYTIEICCLETLISNVQNQYFVENNYDGTNIRTKLINESKTVNIIKYMDEYNNIGEYPILFYSYDDAYKVLNKYDKNASRESYIMIQTMKITEILSTIQPPLTEIRKRKINKLL